jgi:hypothetical protein
MLWQAPGLRSGKNDFAQDRMLASDADWTRHRDAKDRQGKGCVGCLIEPITEYGRLSLLAEAPPAAPSKISSCRNNPVRTANGWDLTSGTGARRNAAAPVSQLGRDGGVIAAQRR